MAAEETDDVDLVDELADPINRQIWDLRVRGRLPMVEVAEEVGLHRTAVWRRLKKIFAAIPALSADEIDAQRHLELAMLEENEARLQSSMLTLDDSDHLGLTRLTTALLRIQTRRAALLGLDAAKRVEVEGLATSNVEALFADAVASLADGESGG